jgi:hypothetical protein
MEPILSRAAINSDAKLAAERCIASGVEQPNPHTEGTDAHAAWRADYSRWLHSLQASEDTESCA